MRAHIPASLCCVSARILACPAASLVSLTQPHPLSLSLSLSPSPSPSSDVASATVHSFATSTRFQLPPQSPCPFPLPLSFSQAPQPRAVLFSKTLSPKTSCSLQLLESPKTWHFYTLLAALFSYPALPCPASLADISRTRCAEKVP
ncbi:hypothetical protein IWX47DRAFT_315918 [Phyllosticta citricarpa]